MSIPDSLVVLNWTEASKLIKAVNPELWEKICTVDGIEKMEFVRARYPYGLDLSSEGNFKLYEHNELKNWQQTNPKINKLLSYGWRTFPA